MEGFYTAKQARIKLGVSEDQFQYLVRIKSVEKFIPQGRKYGVYPRAEIDKLASEANMAATERGKDKTKSLLRTARPGDAQEMSGLVQKVMEGREAYNIAAEERIHYLALPNSEIGHVLVRNRHIIAFFTTLPLKHDQVMQLMDDKVLAGNVPVEDYAKFAPGETIDCFLWEVIADPDDKHIGASIIRKILDFFHILGKRGVEIEGLYIKTTSQIDIDLCRKLHMKELPKPEASQSGYASFEVKVQEANNKFTKNYLQALKSYKKRNYSAF